MRKSKTEKSKELSSELLKQLQNNLYPIVVLESDGKFQTKTRFELIEVNGGGFAISLS